MTWEPLTLTCQLRFCYSRSCAICRIGILLEASGVPFCHLAEYIGQQGCQEGWHRFLGQGEGLYWARQKLEFPSAELPRQLRWDLLDMSGSARTRSNTLQTKPNWCHLMSEKTVTKFSDFPKSSDCAPSFPKNRISSSCCKHSAKKR